MGLRKYINYEHHGNLVFVRRDLKGKHRDHCLCWYCGKFIPDGDKKNCIIARELYAFCIKHKLVTPVWECPVFEQKNCQSCEHEDIGTFIEPCYSCKIEKYNQNWQEKK